MITKKGLSFTLGTISAIILASLISYLYFLEGSDSYGRLSFGSQEEHKILDNNYNINSSNNLEEWVKGLELKIKRIRSKSRQLQERNKNLNQEMNVVETNLDWLKKTTKFGSYTREMLKKLPERVDVESLIDYRSQVNVDLYEIEKALKRGSFSSSDVPHLSHIETDFEFKNLNKVRELYVELAKQLETLISSARHYSTSIKEARLFLTERQVWTYSSLPIWDNIYPLNMNKLFGHDNLNQLIMENIVFKKLNFSFLFFVFFSIILFILNSWSRISLIKISVVQEKIFGNPLKDRFYNTIITLVITFVSSLILPVFFVVCIWCINYSWDGYTYELFDEVTISGFTLLWGIAFVYHSSRNLGILELHFKWSKEVCNILHRRTHFLMLPFLILFILFHLFRVFSIGSESEILRLIYLAIVVLLMGLFKSIFTLDGVRVHFPTFFRSGVGFFTVYYFFLVSFFIVIVTAILGLYVASWKILVLQQFNIFILVGTFLVYQLGERWLILEQRQLGYQRLLARREEKIARENEGLSDDIPMTDIEDQGLDKAVINEQSMTLLKGLCLFFLITLMSTVWSTQLELTNWMDDVVLWNVAQLSAEYAPQGANITLKALIYSVMALIISFVCIRNIPGLLELLILRRLKLSAGTGYTVTTLLRYVILMIGISVAFSGIGIEWERLQWLVAAIGVGLGFGLQEIFANFISGLILLFERPIRIGDTVTINELSGTVSKIQTRSTTIIDWDNKEIVVPNKVFITDKLINWSLTDSVTRIVIQVGVAYGSDISQVEELLYQAVDSTDLVLNQPKPTVYFLNFGESSLDFELRVHINSIDDRLPTIHLINKKINQLFNDHSVEISFPQMDVHVR